MYIDNSDRLPVEWFNYPIQDHPRISNKIIY